MPFSGCTETLWAGAVQAAALDSALNSSCEERAQGVELQTCHGNLLEEGEVREGSGAACRGQRIHPRGAVLDLLLLESWLPFQTAGQWLILALTCQLLVLVMMEVYKGIIARLGSRETYLCFLFWPWRFQPYDEYQ